MPLTPDQFNDYVVHFLPHMEDKQTRRALIQAALSGCVVLDSINWEGDALTFTRRLVQELDTFGNYPGDEPALDTLLQAIDRTPSGVAIDMLPLLPLSDDIRRLPVHQSQVMISYHRGTDGVDTLVNDLQKHNYAVWIDRQGIKLGDSDWQLAIQRGIYTSGGVILCLTNEAARRPVINWEMRTAIALDKPIFAIALEELDDIQACLSQLSLPENLNIEPKLFSGRDTWDEGMAKLIAGLEAADMRVTTHERRKDRSSDEYALHQQYLTSIIANARISRLQLGAINPDAVDIQGTELERIYIPLPTKENLSYEVEDYRVVSWGIQRTRQLDMSPTDWEGHSIGYTQPQNIGWHDTAGLAQIIDQQQADLSGLRQQGDRRWHVSEGVKNVRLLAEDVAAACNRLVVLGGPGSGKSTFVRHLALCLAGEQLDNKTRNINLEGIRNWTHGNLIPIYIELRAFVTSELFPQDLNVMPTADNLWQYVLDCILGEDLADYADQLQYDLLQGHALLMLDGLDEVPYPPGKGNLEKRQEQLKALARSLNDTYGKTRILVASRPYAYEDWTLPDFFSIELAPFGDEERQQLATNLYMAGGDTDDVAQDKAERLNEALSDIDPELKDRPLFVTLMATIFDKGEAEGLPTRKGKLYRESVLLLLERWATEKPNAKTLPELLGESTPQVLLNRLGKLAYDVHDQFGNDPGTPEIPHGLLYTQLFQMQMDDPSVDATGLLAYLSENAGVLVSPGDKTGTSTFHFAHRTFQEYLAARHIVSLCHEADSFDLLRGLMLPRPHLWRTPARLVADVIVDDDDFRDRDLWTIVDDLLPDDAPSTLEPTDQICWLVWLCGRYVLEQEIHEYKLRRREQGSRDNLQGWLTRLIEIAQALPPHERADCGQALGLLGDERAGVGLRPDGLPDIVWCDVPAGTFLYGDDKAGREIAYDYAVSKYLVTNAQFKPFVDGDGYTNRAYWTEAGWQIKESRNWTEPPLWHDAQWNLANHPVVGISWYEAYAYTRWLSAKLGYEVTLPSEEEWEKAARGKDGHIYPWGDDWNATKCNNDVEGKGIRRKSAVGQFPGGTSPYGALDMSGNVWEWCLTEYNTLSNEVEDEAAQLEGGTSIKRVLRGGSWSDFNTDTFYAAFRIGYSPDKWDGAWGLRVSRNYI